MILFFKEYIYFVALYLDFEFLHGFDIMVNEVRQKTLKSVQKSFIRVKIYTSNIAYVTILCLAWVCLRVSSLCAQIRNREVAISNSRMFFYQIHSFKYWFWINCSVFLMVRITKTSRSENSRWVRVSAHAHARVWMHSIAIQPNEK